MPTTISNADDSGCHHVSQWVVLIVATRLDLYLNRSIQSLAPDMQLLIWQRHSSPSSSVKRLKVILLICRRHNRIKSLFFPSTVAVLYHKVVFGDLDHLGLLWNTMLPGIGETKQRQTF